MKHVLLHSEAKVIRFTLCSYLLGDFQFANFISMFGKANEQRSLRFVESV